MFLQLPHGGDTVFQLPLPVVPKLRRNLLAPIPIARRVGAKRFFLLNSLGEIHHFRNLWAKNLTSLTIVSMPSVLPPNLRMDSSDVTPSRLFSSGEAHGLPQNGDSALIKRRYRR